MAASLAAPRADEASLTGEDAAPPPDRYSNKMAASLAAPKVGGASPTGVDAAPPPDIRSGRMAASLAAQKAGRATPAGVCTGPPVKKSFVKIGGPPGRPGGGQSVPNRGGCCPAP